MFEIIFLIAVSVYFFQTFLFIIGIKKKFRKIGDADLPDITVVVAARNEEDNILECLRSLDNLIYQQEKIEIIIVDDYSEDRTFEIAKDFIKGKSKFKLIKPSKDFGEVKGKARAISNAIEIAKGEIILTTDSDCVVSPTWALTHASYYDSNVAMVCGYTNQFANSTFQAIQSIDFIYLLSVAAGTMNLNKPLSCIGNNMSYRKSVYKEIGGYESLPFSVTEDLNLLMAFANLKKYKIIFPFDAEALVTSKPCGSLKEIYSQKKRWGIGGLEARFEGFLLTGIGWVNHLLILLSPFFFSANVLTLIFFKLAVDYFFLAFTHKGLKLTMKFKDFLFFEIYFTIYVLLIPFIAIFGKEVRWKGRKFTK